jgi:hypothetical protein
VRYVDRLVVGIYERGIWGEGFVILCAGSFEDGRFGEITAV